MDCFKKQSIQINYKNVKALLFVFFVLFLFSLRFVRRARAFIATLFFYKKRKENKKQRK
jgi:lauroyl/myristoyl acyltransferase